MQVLWPFLKFIMGITHKITQCNISKCVMNASQNPIQILGYQISLNKSPTLSSSTFEDLRGPVCRAGFTTPRRHLSSTQRRGLGERRGWEKESIAVLLQWWQHKCLYLHINLELIASHKINRGVSINKIGLIFLQWYKNKTSTEHRVNF